MTENIPETPDKSLIPAKSFKGNMAGDIFFNIEKFEHAQRVARLFSTSTMIPDTFRGEKNIGSIMIAFNLAERYGTDPIILMQNIYVIHGKPGMEAKLLISLLSNCGKFGPIQYIEKGNLSSPDSDNDGCQAYATFKETGEKLTGPMVTWRMVKAEGWYGKPQSKWKTIPEIMFRYRAASFFTKLYAPDILLGMQTKEELMDMVPIDVTPRQPALPETTEQNPATVSLGPATSAADQAKTLEDYKPEEPSLEGETEEPDPAAAKKTGNRPKETKLPGEDAQQPGPQNDDEFMKTTVVKTGPENLGDLGNPTLHEKWKGLRRGSAGKSGLAFYIDQNRQAFEEAWQLWTDDPAGLRELLRKKYTSFYGKPLPWEIETAASNDVEKSEDGPKETGEVKQISVENAQAWCRINDEKDPMDYTGTQANIISVAAKSLNIDMGKDRTWQDVHVLVKQHLKALDSQGEFEDKKNDVYKDGGNGISTDEAKKWCIENLARDVGKAYNDNEMFTITIAAKSLGIPDSGKTPHSLHREILEALKASQAELLDDDIAELERFNNIFIQEKGTQAWHYAQGEATGDENNSFRPKPEQIKPWLEAYDEFKASTEGF